MRFKKTGYYFIILTGIITFALTACQDRDSINKDLSHHSETTFLMGTVVQIDIYGSEGEKLIKESFERIREIEEKMSRNIPDSEINQINNSVGKFVKVSEDTFRVLEKAVAYAELTDGKFEPGIGALVELWGIGTERARIPSEQEINKAREKVDYNSIILDREGCQVKLLREGMSLDLGAIAKGYAADELRKIILSKGIKSAYLNLGGNVLVIGSKPDGSPWRIGIQDPGLESGKIMARLKIEDQAVVTSGNYERYFEEGGIIYHHIIDPETGYPARNGVITVSIISSAAFDADALSTAVFLMGTEKGMELVEGMEGKEAIIVTEKKEVFLSTGLKGKVELFNSDFSLKG
ncbi:MAG TPA: FAD:protein FMN transferase [Halanaerobiales bacterium]|nr:FAD:protein FMN transferase [Halanaerobiales bacterium]